MTIFPVNNRIELGASWLSVPIEPSHPFYRAVVQHDARYQQLMDKDPQALTLAQIDREFARNMSRAVLALPSLADKVRYARRAWIFYRAARTWAKLVRAELDDYLGGE